MECEVFIVGINAATEMEADFWAFWTKEKGFDKAKWMDCYIAERKSQPLKPNKTRRNKLSNTRQRIEWIIESSSPVKILETNLFVKATTAAADLENEERESSVFDFLLETIKPKLIFIHGEEVIDYFENLFKIKIEKSKVLEFEIKGVKTKILAEKHLSRGWSKVKSLELGDSLQDKI